MVLIPIAVWLAVRWALAVFAVEFEGLSATDALRRSGRLVRRQWLKVASYAVFGAALALMLGPLVGALMILLTSAPLATLNLVAGVVNAVTIPFVALTTAYVYFDARARVELEPVDEPDELPAEFQLSGDGPMSDVEVLGRIGPDGPALLVLYTGGTFGMGHDADGSLVPLDLRELRDHLPFLRRLPLALTVATFPDPIDSSAMRTSDWLDIADAIVDPCAGTCRSGRAPRHRHDGLHGVRSQLPARGHRHPDRVDRCAAIGHRAAIGRPREPGDRPGDRGRAPARRAHSCQR